jgi:hypothetical protein
LTEFHPAFQKNLSAFQKKSRWRYPDKPHGLASHFENRIFSAVQPDFPDPFFVSA